MQTAQKGHSNKLQILSPSRPLHEKMAENDLKTQKVTKQHPCKQKATRVFTYYF